MNGIESGSVFSLADILPYTDGELSRLVLKDSPGLKFLLLSFDAGTELPEHSAPGEVLIFCLEGEGIIINEGKEHPIKAGENFIFAKNALHAVKAVSRFKMLVAMTKEN